MAPGKQGCGEALVQGELVVVGRRYVTSVFKKLWVNINLPRKREQDLKV